VIPWGIIPQSHTTTIDLTLRRKRVTEEVESEKLTVDTVLRATVGRVVHYVSYGTPGGEFPSVCRAAIIAEATSLPDGTCTLAVLNPSGIFFGAVVFDENGTPGTWHWPERV
jgi:hypothetical protein